MSRKILLIIFIAIFIGVIAVQAVNVQATPKPLEVEYPAFPSLPLLQTPNTVKTLLPGYVEYVITFGMIFSGLITFGSLLFASFLYMTSSGNPSVIKSSKERMFSAFLGAIILLSSYLILNTINPNLIELKIDPRASIEGVTFVDISGERYTVITSVPDFEATPLTAVPVTVEFPALAHIEVIPCLGINLQDCDYNQKLTSTGNFPSNALSARLIWKTPGVYLYDDTDYGGELRVYATNQGSLIHFNDKAESISFLHPLLTPNAVNRFFGTVLHKDEGFQGDCEFIWNMLPSLGSGNNAVSSLTVFKYKKNCGDPPDPYVEGSPPETILNNGGGVQFYENPNYLTPVGGYHTSRAANWTKFTDQSMPDDGIYSIKINGDYLVAIAQDTNGEGRCEIFTKSDSDLSDNPIGQCILIGICSPECWGILGFCPLCTGSCASSFRVIPLANW